VSEPAPQPDLVPAGDPGTIAIVGLGLIGGSLARDLAALGVGVVGVDRDPGALEAALAAGVIVRGHEGAHLDEALADADVVILAAPVGALPGLIKRVSGAAPKAVISDVGSTKRSAAAAAAAAGIAHRFVGAHPMAGDTASGWTAARPGLFAGAPVWLCPGPGAPASAVARIEAIWRQVGALPRTIDPVAHDRLLAWSSHLPQLVASALGTALAGAGVDRDLLGPGGRDTTRLAASDPVVWTDILLDNRDQVGDAVDGLLQSLARLRAALETGDAHEVDTILRAARGWAAGDLAGDLAGGRGGGVRPAEGIEGTGR
jgi:prephenate dehydrogenase